MNLKEIQNKAEAMLIERSDNMYLPTTKVILELIANLAARMQEIEDVVLSAFKALPHEPVEFEDFTGLRKSDLPSDLNEPPEKLLQQVVDEADARARDVEKEAIVPEAWGIKPVCRAEKLLKSGNKGHIKIKGKRMFLIGVKEYKEALALLRSDRDGV